MWIISFIGEAEKQIMKLPRFEQERIRDALERLKITPFSLDIVRLGDKKQPWRLRVGSYRIFFELFQKEKAIFVYNIKSQKTNK